MKKLKPAVLLIITVLAGGILAACGRKSEKMDTVAIRSYDDDYYTTESSSESYDSSSGDTNGLSSTTELIAGNTDIMTMDKIITKVNLDVETQNFDELIAAIKEQITKLGGYDEKTEISGRSYYGRDTSRHGYIVARIPKDKLSNFVEAVKGNGNVINESSTSENVTLQYVETESRKKSLEIEQERLFAILEKTESLEDIVTLESRLSSIRHELQMYETELRTIDNQVEYSTVTLSIYEVKRITPTDESETVISRIKKGFSETIFDISEGFKNFVVWFVVNLPYLIIWGVVISACILVINKIYKKVRSNGKKGKKEEVIKADEKISDNGSKN